MNAPGYKDLTKGEKFIFDWQYNQLNTFGYALIELLKLSEIVELNKLSRGFPDEVTGFMDYSYSPGWWTFVQKKAFKELFKPN